MTSVSAGHMADIVGDRKLGHVIFVTCKVCVYFLLKKKLHSGLY